MLTLSPIVTDARMLPAHYICSSNRAVYGEVPPRCNPPSRENNARNPCVCPGLPGVPGAKATSRFAAWAKKLLQVAQQSSRGEGHRPALLAESDQAGASEMTDHERCGPCSSSPKRVGGAGAHTPAHETGLLMEGNGQGGSKQVASARDLRGPKEAGSGRTSYKGVSLCVI